MHKRPKKIIVDTDPGIDDVMAIFYLASLSEVKLIGISTIFGNSDVETTTRNARYLAQRFSLDAPIFQGAADPVRIPRNAPPIAIHGQNGLGDVDLSGAPLAGAVAGPAYQHIIDLVRAHPHQVTLVAIGPLTNLSLALTADPQIAGLVEQVVVMGGAFGGGGRHGNVSAVAEANIYNDPHAADHVFSAPWPVTIVGLDVTMRCVMDDAEAEALARRGGPRGRFVWEISRRYAEAYRKFDGLDGCCLHDVAAVAYAIDPTLFETRSGPVRVVTSGAAIGQTVQAPDTRATGPAPHPGSRSPVVCIDVDAPRLVRAFADALIGDHLRGSAGSAG